MDKNTMNKYLYAFTKTKEALQKPNKPYKYSVKDMEIKCLQCGNHEFTADVPDALAMLISYQLTCSKCSFIMLFKDNPNRVKDDQGKG